VKILPAFLSLIPLDTHNDRLVVGQHRPLRRVGRIALCRNYPRHEALGPPFPPYGIQNILRVEICLKRRDVLSVPGGARVEDADALPFNGRREDPFRSLHGIAV
jgi:hypothetical protein